MLGKVVSAVLALALSGPAVAADAQDRKGRSLAATCTGCHGTDGVSAGGIPSLAGIDTTRIVQLMHEFRSGKRPATVMHQHAIGYTDAQIEAIAVWFARRK